MTTKHSNDPTPLNASSPEAGVTDRLITSRRWVQVNQQPVPALRRSRWHGLYMDLAVPLAAPNL